MCYSNQCKYERFPSGECKGAKDWKQPDALCNMEEIYSDEYEKEIECTEDCRGCDMNCEAYKACFADTN